MTLKKELKPAKVAFMAVIASMGGWFVFQGITDMFPMGDLQPISKVLLGLFIAWAVFKFGIKK